MKILSFTSIRSEYDLLSPLYKLLHEDEDIDFKLIVSGAHLSESFGYTKKQIQQDGFEILAELETLINSNTLKSKLKTASILLQNSIDLVANFNPDLIIFAGDREDVFVYGLLGVYLKIPTIHFYGGDHEMAGHEDTVIRHATSKLATFHFVSCEEHKQRLIKLGETEKRIYNIGSVALDKFVSHVPISIDKISSILNLNTPKKFALLIYHPISEENDAFENILEVLKEKEIFAFVSYPNTDAGNMEIINSINKYQYDNNFYFFKNLDRDIFLTIFKKSMFIIGNSSAGMLEAASIPIPAINVGLRQKNRLSGDNVIFCNSSKSDIEQSIIKITSPEFIKNLENIKNIFGDGKSGQKAYKLIKSINFNTLLHKIEDPLCL